MCSIPSDKNRGGKSASNRKHPYLTGNFAPIPPVTYSHAPCTYTGRIPKELYGGQYVRNGSNPITIGNEAMDSPGSRMKNYHWFDGDGMLCGVYFQTVIDDRTQQERVIPRFTNQFVLTDLAINRLRSHSAHQDNQKDGKHKRALRTKISQWILKNLYSSPILPSMATLVDPGQPLVVVLWEILKSVLLVCLTWLAWPMKKIKFISVANTGICFHDGRALATCESGPPIHVQLPTLRTVGWSTGAVLEEDKETGETVDVKKHLNSGESSDKRFGGTGPLSWMRAWTTGHPKTDSSTGELILFHNSFVPPYVHASVISPTMAFMSTEHPPRGLPIYPKTQPSMMNVPVPDCMGSRMRHDFGVSLTHTVIVDVPLELDPFNLLRNKPIVDYRPDLPARFGVFPRRKPGAVRWYETDGCCIFHTANTWDEYDAGGNIMSVNMLVCRMTSASLVYTAGNLESPSSSRRGKQPKDSSWASEEESPLLDPGNCILDETEQCRLYFYQFSLSSTVSAHSSRKNAITSQYALSAIPFEFPILNPDYEMSLAHYIWGCSTTASSFSSALGSGTKIDVLVKFNVQRLIEAAEPTKIAQSVHMCHDRRDISQILASKDTEDPIKAFRLPPFHYAQEPRFVERRSAEMEDDGYLLFYVFDERQLDERGECPSDAKSELWILDARNMADLIGKVVLPTRVPYGLHGTWFGKEKIERQRSILKYRSWEANPRD